MAGEPNITVVGNLTADPELRFTPQGKAVASLNLACTPRRKVDGSWKDGDTMWYRVTVWEQYAENVVESLLKGARVVVVGRLSCRKWETREGEERTSWEISADEVCPSLRFATAAVRKLERGTGGYNSTEDPWAVSLREDPTEPASNAGAGGGRQPWQNEPPFVHRTPLPAV
jgi:single-strand DNA-binding protein